MDRTLGILLILAAVAGAVVYYWYDQRSAEIELPGWDVTLDPAALKENEFAYRVRIVDDPDSDPEENMGAREISMLRMAANLENLLEGNAAVSWRDRDHLVVAFNESSIKDDEAPSALDAVEETLDSYAGIYRSRSQLAFIVIAEDREGPEGEEIDLSSRTAELVKHLREAEAGQGGWSLEIDLSPLSFDAVDSGRAVRCEWLPVAPATIAISTSLNVEEYGFPRNEALTFDELRPDDSTTDEQIARLCFRLVQVYENPAWQFTARDLRSTHSAYDSRDSFPVL